MQRQSSKFIESQRWCAFLLHKGKEGGGAYPWALLQGITLCVPERMRQRSRGASCHLSISPLQVLFILLFFPSPVYTNCFFLQLFCFSNYALLSVNARYCCGNSREGTMRPPNSKSLFLSLGCQSYHCQFSFTVQ